MNTPADRSAEQPTTLTPLPAASSEPALPTTVVGEPELQGTPEAEGGALPLRKGDQFDRYELLGELAHGGMGVVFAAHDPVLGRTVALKMLRSGALANPREIERFRREAEAAARLDHPHIVAIHDIGEHRGQHYFTMALVAGGSLAKRIAEFRLPIVDWKKEPSDSKMWSRSQIETRKSRIVNLMIKVACAVHFAHANGILHRDLKPGNILIGENGEPRVSDFGLAKLLDADVDLTRPGMALGTPAYMAPEQINARSDRLSPRTDVWGLGVILYELLVGRRPFVGDDRDEMLNLILTSDPLRPRALQRAVDTSLEAVILKCLEKDPAHRYATAKEFADDLENWSAGKPVRARRLNPAIRVGRWVKRHPWETVAGAAVALLALMAVFYPRTPPAPEVGPPRVEKRRVTITTDPPGADIAFIPLNAQDGEPDVERAVTPKDGAKTPVTISLEPGQYLVEALNAEGRFHQVWRQVPREGQPSHEPLPHLHAKDLPDGRVQLPEIKLPALTINEGMAYFAERGVFLMGSPEWPPIAPHHRFVRAFYLDTAEVSVGEHRKANPKGLSQQPAGRDDSYPMTNVSFDMALDHAEWAGKRLMTELEYEYAATFTGRRKYPWGDDPGPAPAEWKIGPARKPSHDILPTEPPVLNLYSNVAEWTSSWMAHYPSKRDMPYTWDLQQVRVVRGGTSAVVMGEPRKPAPEYSGPRYRQFMDRRDRFPGLGFRCARSAAPLVLGRGTVASGMDGNFRPDGAGLTRHQPEAPARAVASLQDGHLTALAGASGW